MRTESGGTRVVRFARPFLFVFGSSDPPRFRFRAPGARRNARAGAADASLDSLVTVIVNQKTAQRRREIVERALVQKLTGVSPDELAASKPTLQPLLDVKDKLKSGMLLAVLESALAPQVSFFTFVSPPRASLVDSRERSPALNRATR